MHYRLSVGAARVRLIHALLLLTTLSACANTAAFSESGLNDGALAADVVRGEAETSAANTPRMLIYRADLEILVSDPQRAGDKAKLIVQALGGYIENASQGDGRYARLTLRVPAAKLDRALSDLSALGKEKHRQITATDVTENYIDVQAKLQNAITLRNRLRTVLDRATKIKDILAIEKELARVQSEIDAMEGQLKHLRGQSQMASITLSF